MLISFALERINSPAILNHYCSILEFYFSLLNSIDKFRESESKIQMQIQTFRNAPIYGVKMYDNLVRTGVKVATAGGYNQSKKGFNLTWTSTEGVANGYQVIRFDDIQVARLLAQSVNGDIVKQKGEAEFAKLPIAMPEGGVVWAWVNSKKLNFISPSAWERFKADYPTEEEEIGLSSLDDLDENKSI